MSTEKLKISKPSDTELCIERVFDAPRQLVWDAHTKPDLIKRWLTGPPGNTLPICELDLRVGGALRYVWRLEDASEMSMRGSYRELNPPERIVHTEFFEDFPHGGESVVTTLFIEEGDKTRVSMTTKYATTEALDANQEYGMEEGVGASYENLDLLLTDRS
ncbi:MAG: SRPBCC family protein [Leptospirales bacterium]|jgi:uncharacterized protein YndB with AHSA1/START domain